MKLEQNAVSPIGTPSSSKFGMWDDGIEVGHKDVSLGLNSSLFFKFTWKPSGGPSDCMISRARDTDVG